MFLFFWTDPTLGHVQSCQPFHIGHNLSRPCRLYYAITPMMKSCQKMQIELNDKMVIFMCMLVCVGGGGGIGRDSISDLHFPVVVPQLIGVCTLKQWANRSAWFIFLGLVHHFLARQFLAKYRFYSSADSLWSRWRRRLTKTGPLATSRKIQKLIQQTFRGESRTNIHVL